MKLPFINIFQNRENAGIVSLVADWRLKKVLTWADLADLQPYYMYKQPFGNSYSPSIGIEGYNGMFFGRGHIGGGQNRPPSF